MTTAASGYPLGMEPIPETFEALEEFGPYLYDEDLLTELGRMGQRVQEIVPECVGLSLAYREHGVTFTLVASDETIAALDAAQYLDGGPCLAAVDREEILEFNEGDVLDEGQWQLFARGTDAAAIASTLTLPIVVGEKIAGSVNLYASSPDAFTGKHQRVAEAVGAWAEGAVANADLDFTTRRAAEEAPRQLFEETRIQVAVGILAASQDVSTTVARERMREAALRAGVDEGAIARLVIEQATERRRPGLRKDAERDRERDSPRDDEE